MSTLRELYEAHDGKLSDRWSLYLDTYERVLSPLRHRELRLLEIGVQNGGSLELWSKYFPRARKLVGCDINPKCGLLRYDDPRIEVIVGDANESIAHRRIADATPELDLVIDDGSHTSGDIVRSFSLYFPLLLDGGLFIAEDLHCSYWKDFQGGLFEQGSSMAFFKALADILNHEHWGRPYARGEMLSSFAQRWGASFAEDQLARIHSVEFVNSVCIVRKAEPERNVLGPRVIARGEELVVPGHHELAGATIERYDQHQNPSAALDAEPARLIPAQAAEIRKLQDELRCAQQRAAAAQHEVDAIYASRSWRYTGWLRRIAGALRRDSYA